MSDMHSLRIAINRNSRVISPRLGFWCSWNLAAVDSLLIPKSGIARVFCNQRARVARRDRFCVHSNKERRNK